MRCATPAGERIAMPAIPPASAMKRVGQGIVESCSLDALLAKSPTIVPVIGARTRAQLTESLGALDIDRSPADVARIEETVPPDAVAGTRYGEDQMRVLDSEKPA
jgi:hypothetical protein